jgi:quinoprotein dehydrogenase-associated probable ABC transporter substrate-binding protein
MSSRCPERVLRAFVVVGALAVAPACARELVVCADPDDLPYSKQDGSGFENRVAEIVAHEIGAELRYAWQPLRRGVVRKTLGAGRCDMLAGVPVGLEGVATTAPYYRSGYAFVYRRDEASPLRSFDDPRLRRAKIGIQLVGADMAATPAALALARRGIVANVVGFPVYGAEVAAQRMIAALDAGSIDVAVIWGAQAGYFAQRAQHPLAVSIAHDDAPAPQVFAIALGVRRDRTALRDVLDAALVRARDRIRAILDAFDVPRVEPAAHIAERPR